MTWSYILNIDRGPYSHVGRMVMVMVISLIDCVSIFFLDALGAGKRPVFFFFVGNACVAHFWKYVPEV